jgi:hypothetical protein
MDKQLTIGVVLILSILLCGCVSNTGKENNLETDIELNCEPLVVITGYNYTSNPESVPYEEIHSFFAQNYTGSDLSIELRDVIIQNITDKAFGLGENSTILFEVIKVIYNDTWDKRPTRIPCYAEKAFYENESVWIIAFNRANSFIEGIHHFDIYFVSIPIIKAQYITGCNSSAIVYQYGCR